MRGRFLVKPKANKDLDDYAQYLVGRASLNVALRFLASARETFSLLSTQPQMGWHSRLNNPRLKALLVFRIAGFENMLVLYRPLPAGVEILRVVHGSRNLQALFRRRGEVE